MSSSSKVASRLCGPGLGADLPGGTLPSPAPVPGQSWHPPSNTRHPPSLRPSPSREGGRGAAGPQEGSGLAGPWGKAERERGARPPRAAWGTPAPNPGLGGHVVLEII